MSAGILERVSFVQADVRVYTGMAVQDLAPDVQVKFGRQIYDALGEGKKRGHMHQPPLEEIISGMKGGQFVVSVEHTEEGTPFLIATSHIRDAKFGVGKEIGGVLNLQERKGHGALVVQEGVWLAEKQGASFMEALVANTNSDGQGFFSRLQGVSRIGERPSNYVTDAKGEPVMMTVFDVKNITRRGM